MTAHVAVLLGGWSAEREVSLLSGAAVAEALQKAGYRVTTIDAGRDVATTLYDLRPDVVFNALHGPFGEDGTMQGLLEVIGLPYTHSPVIASAIAMDKAMTKAVLAPQGIPFAESRVVHRDAVLAGGIMDMPFVLKPVNEGSSVGVRIVACEEDFATLCRQPWSYGIHVLVEKYIPGRELTVAVMDGRPLEVLELRPRQGFYDYDAKYTEGLTEHILPAPMEEEDYSLVREYAAHAHKALGCRGVTRADFRYDEKAAPGERIFMLEINTQPGMTPLSLVPESAAHDGMDFVELVRWITEDGLCRK